jgi:hypothetical protein
MRAPVDDLNNVLRIWMLDLHCEHCWLSSKKEKGAA